MNMRNKLFQPDNAFTFRLLRTLFVLVALAFGLAVYLHIASVQYAVNDKSKRIDQGSYMIFSRKAHFSQFMYTGDRNRMPLYPWIQAVFYSPEFTDEEFFEQGKAINTVISMLGIVVIGVASIRRFSRPFVLYSLIVISYMLFALKAPYFQAEILYYILFWLAFVLAVESIRKPARFKSIALGATFALAHFTKASAMPGLIVYAISFAVPLLQGRFGQSSGPSKPSAIIGYAVLPLVIFAVLLFPYFSESRDRYGQYLYNVNTTFYMWYDSWGEASEGTKKAGDRAGWPDLPAEEIPSLARYISEHSVEEILHRFSNSALTIWRGACNLPDSRYMYGNCIHIAAGAVIFLLIPAFYLFRQGTQFRATQLHAATFALCFLILYMLGAVWYYPIIHGPRVMFALILPLFWTFGLVERYVELDRFTYVLLGHEIRPMRIVYGVLILIAVIQVYELATFRAATLFGAK